MSAKAGDPGTLPMLLRRFWFDIPLWKRIIPGFVLGIAAGLLLGEQARAFEILGTIFIRLARMLVVPLIFFTITAGVLALGDPKRLGSVGVRTLGMFAATAFAGATIGMIVGALLEPGSGVSLAGVEPKVIATGRPLEEQLLSIIAANPVKALAEGEMLAIIFFAVFLSIGILLVGAPAKPLGDVIAIWSEVMMRLIVLVMETAPFGVFGLMASAVGANGLDVFLNIGLLAAGTLLGCLLQVTIVHAGVVGLLRLSPTHYFRAVADALVIAFSTSSSSASLPAEMTVARNRLGIKKPIRSTVLPVGVGIARDGTAMFVALLSMFALQTLGFAPTPGDLLLVVCVSTLLALGAPPVPSAAMFMMAGVLGTVGVSDLQAAMVVAFVLPFDRLLDMMRTTVNVSANLLNATTIARWSGEIDLTALSAGRSMRTAAMEEISR